MNCRQGRGDIIRNRGWESEPEQPSAANFDPAYKPGGALLTLVSDLLDRGVEAIIVVNDGSGPEFDGCFAAIAVHDRVFVVHHAVNLGKGAALKSGMNYAAVRFRACLGFVTADADGQHSPEDILRVADRLRANSNALVIRCADL
jgi:glycosyltransferase involved in cell wall biosynthesis